ncbi:MAG: hypothetical protein H7099_17350 [Gemmatimonadaceae bacterium]|nr:hypothetical protein [Gemmatimonadaceae bacterium]
MSPVIGWGLALGAGLVVAWIAYPSGAVPRIRPLLMFLRVLAVIAVLALLFDLPIGEARPPAPLVAIDASASWTRGADSASWRLARDSAAAAGTAAQTVVFGDSARNATIPSQPADLASRVAPAIQRAAATGQRIVVITDGGLDDPDALLQAVAGSRVVVLPLRPTADRALADISVPSEGRVGDTITVQARVVADAAAPSATSVRWSLDAAALTESPVPALAAGGEAVVESRIVIPPGDSIAVLRASLVVGDMQPRNDTLAAAFRRGARQRVVIVSTAPDADLRDVATSLRANVALPTDAYFRIAAGRWVRDNTFAPVEESVVRAAVRGATLAVLHGDTTVMGAPSGLGTRALLLLAPPDADAPELMVRAAPSSPLQAALSGIVLESLPPLMATSPARGGVAALNAAPGAAATGAMTIVTAIDGDVRRVVITAAGYSRWRARGGVSEAAFQALVGSSTDWLLGARGRAAVPVLSTQVVRAGAVVRWRRGAQPRSTIVLTRDGDRAVRRDSLVFGTLVEATMPALAGGVWRGTVDGIPVVIPVSASREWLPRASTVRTGALNGPAIAMRRGARSISWIYLATVLLLAMEWLLRRRAGLR